MLEKLANGQTDRGDEMVEKQLFPDVLIVMGSKSMSLSLIPYIL